MARQASPDRDNAFAWSRRFPSRILAVAEHHGMFTLSGIEVGLDAAVARGVECNVVMVSYLEAVA
jgi:hypothetical protein